MDRTSSPKNIFSFNDWQFFRMSPNGDYFWQIVIYTGEAEREQQIWLHDRTGASNLLTSAPWINLDYGKPAFSVDGRDLAYTSTTDFKIFLSTLYRDNNKTDDYNLRSPRTYWLAWLGTLIKLRYIYNIYNQ